MQHENQSAAFYDPRESEAAILLETLDLQAVYEPARTNYFSIYFVREGRGNVWADSLRFEFPKHALIFLVPYQYVRFEPLEGLLVDRVQFHANFLCVETFHAEVGCSGVLFNDPQGVPVVSLDQAAADNISKLIDELREECKTRALAYCEVLLALLKLLLIRAARCKNIETWERGAASQNPRHEIVLAFRAAIEANYKTIHSASEYASLLHISPQNLGRIVREHLDTTPSDLIRNRIITHAKWHLLHTRKTVKEIAREVGFDDEHYFSRLFKKATGCSPTFFRDYETEIRGGSNLSMD